VDVAELTPGLYLLQLQPRDPWSATAPSRPPAGGLNTLTIHIVSAGDLRRGQVFLIDSAQDDRGRLHNLEISYRVKIIGKIVNRILPSRTREGRHVLVTETNEGWYAGRLEVVVFDEPAFLAEIEDANPVKLEYSVSADCVTAIEDRYGEGPMLCTDCRRLYWSDERLKDEERRKHSLFGPIVMFPIRWER
jgi:hypothetical protein